MPIRFSTQAANADKMNDDAGGQAQGTPNATATDALPRDKGQRKIEGEDAGQARPGKDINAPGFVKDRDSSKP